MPMIEIDTNAKNILIDWKKHFGSDVGAAVDYSEAIRCANNRVFPIPSDSDASCGKHLNRNELKSSLEGAEK